MLNFADQFGYFSLLANLVAPKRRPLIGNFKKINKLQNWIQKLRSLFLKKFKLFLSWMYFGKQKCQI